MEIRQAFPNEIGAIMTVIAVSYTHLRWLFHGLYLFFG